MLDRARKYLSIILQIFVRDLKRLVVNPVACIILAGVCILPALYAWYTIETDVGSLRQHRLDQSGGGK